MKKPIFIALASMLSVTACSSTGLTNSASSSADNQRQRPAMSAELKQAMHECAASTGVTINNNTRPSRSDMQKLESCMSAKGFEKPRGKGRPPA